MRTIAIINSFSSFNFSRYEMIIAIMTKINDKTKEVGVTLSWFMIILTFIEAYLI